MIDEFDHVYRADSVAAGYWATWDTPKDGRGDLIPVRTSVIVAGQEICRTYDYPGRDNCRPVENVGDGRSTVASAASRYHPVYYWLIGRLSFMGEGATAVYIMRFAAGVYCAIGVAAAAWCLTKRARSAWPLAALSLALTPVLVYSTAVPAPNGIEMIAGLGLWSILVGILSSPRGSASLAVMATAFGTVLATVRSLGTLWLALILVSSGPLFASREVRRSLGQRRSAWIVGGILVALAALASITWVLTAGTYELEQERTRPMNPWAVALGQAPLWVAQSIAAFPIRDNPAPTAVYALMLVPFIGLLIAALARGSNPVRIALALCITLSMVVPYAFTVLTVETTGTIWQGRYTLPLSIGAVILAGYALDTTPPEHRLTIPLVRVFAVGVAAAHSISVITVQLREEAISPLADDPRWWQVDASLVGLMTVLGIFSWWWAIELLHRQTSQERPPLVDGPASV